MHQLITPAEHISGAYCNDIVCFSHGAYSDEKTYSMDDIREIVSYGHKRGVRVIMEIAIPASVGHGWQWGPQGGLGNLTVCMNQMPGWNHCEKPPCGALNLANPNIYKILELIYKDLLQVIQKREVLHLGGEEVNYKSSEYHFMCLESDFI